MSVEDQCRLCAEPKTRDFRNVFNKDEVNCDNMADIIFVMTQVKVEPTDSVSQKVCSRCCNIVQKMFKYRQDAQKQDKALKEKFDQLSTKGIKLPNTSVTIRRENLRKHSASKSSEEGLESKTKSVKDTITTGTPNKVVDDISTSTPNKVADGITTGTTNKVADNSNNKKVKVPPKIHPSITNIFIKNPNLKLPKRSFAMDLNPTVSLKMGEVETYFKKNKLDIKNFIWLAQGTTKIAKKKTTQTSDTASDLSDSKTVAPIKISKKILEKHDANLIDCRKNSDITLIKGTKRKRSLSITSASTSISTASTSDHNTEVNQLREAREKTPVQNASKTESSTPGTPGSLLVVSSETKSQPIFVCDLCGSVHNSHGMLRLHLAKKHMVCQFCKKRFKTLETKDEHIQNECRVKQIMNSEEPKVKLQKVDKILEIRRKYQSAFTGWVPLPGLESVELKKSSTANAVVTEPVKDYGIIEILSDDDEPSNHSSFTKQTSVVSPAVSDIKLKPDVRIKNNFVLGNITQNASDVQVIKELLGIVLPKSNYSHLETQTEFPDNDSIKINLMEGNAELKNLKEHLKVFKLPLTIKHGEFNARYTPRKENSKSPLQYWEHLPVIDVPPHQIKKNKDYFSTTPTAALTLDQVNENVQDIPTRNVAPPAAALTSQKITPLPPAPKVAVPTGNLRYAASSVPVNNNLTPQLSIPKPSVNYSPLRTVIPGNNSPVILNHQINAFSASNSGIANISKSSTTVVNPAAASITLQNVVNPPTVSNNAVFIPASYPTPTPQRFIRVKSVKELQ